MHYLKVPLTSPARFVSAGQFTSEKPWIHGTRCLDTFEIIIGINGTAYIQQDEEQYVVEPGCILLLLPGHTHRGFASSNPPVSFQWFHFQFDLPYQILEPKDVESEIFLLSNNPYLKSLEEFILLPVFSEHSKGDRVSILFHQMLHAAQSEYFTRYAQDYLLSSLLIELTESFIANFTMTYETKKTERSFAKILEWIRIHYIKNISVDDIVEKFHYNPDYLSRLFKQKMGMNMQAYLHILKIAKAKELLYESEKNIKEIAYSVGFKDEKYFMKLFKRYENTTPTAFRNAYFNTHLNRR